MKISTPEVTPYLVGGAVRDRLMGKESHDWDFAVEAQSWDHMEQWLDNLGFQIFVSSPEYLTIRARCEYPVSFAGIEMEHQTFDFVLCRKDGEYADGRRPTSVEAGTIFDDLARRDFTCNAVALAEDGSYIDPHGGRDDIEEGVLRLVGGRERLLEDGLRAIRAIRFFVTTGFDMDYYLHTALYDGDVLDTLAKVSPDRIRDELNKMLKHDPAQSITVLAEYPDILDIAIGKGVWFKATSETR